MHRMCQFFKERGYPESVVTTGNFRAHEIDRETAPQTSQNEERKKNKRIPSTLTDHPQNLAVTNVSKTSLSLLRASGSEEPIPARHLSISCLVLFGFNVTLCIAPIYK